MKHYIVRMQSYFTQRSFAWPEKIEWFDSEEEALEFAHHNECRFNRIYLDVRERGQTISTVCLYDNIY